ncbi:LysR family transcriptional regulator [Rhodococcus sp. USK10]|nr:LysR family transcriptional regulator [Rhodococcus sp. USK10]
MSDQPYQPTLTQLRAFAAVAAHLHFGTAASDLGISQPTLSRALAALETGLGVTLIERSSRRTILTAAGGRLLPYAQRTLDATEEFVASATAMASRRVRTR